MKALQSSLLALFLLLSLSPGFIHGNESGEAPAELATSKGVINIKDNVILYDMDPGKIITDNADAGFYCIGENHTEYSNHLKQLELIKKIRAKKKNIAIGMEMFSKDFQDVINDYIQGRINEHEFLKRTRYFREWGYDYKLYKRIIDFARENRIPVVALNLENRIVRDIGQRGFREMRQGDLDKIPDQIGYDDEIYQKHLGEIFMGHGLDSSRSFENFYLAQLIRDEHMSQVAVDYQGANPEITVIVLAGNGHMEGGHGVPSRIKRHSGKTCTTILIDSPYYPGRADFFVYTKPESYERTPQLNLMLRDDEGKVIVAAVLKQAGAEGEKFKPNDQILSINGKPVASVEEIRLVLYSRRPGEQLVITLLREEKQIEIVYLLGLIED